MDTENNTFTVTKRDAVVAGATAGAVILAGTILVPIAANKMLDAAVNTFTFAKSKATKKAKSE